MDTFDELARRYIASWNETDPSARRRAVDELYADDARYVDPLAVAQGREAITDLIGAVQGQFGGFRFWLAGPVDGHHDQARFTWELGPDGAEAPIVGFDVVTTDGEGRLRAVHGFLDKVPRGLSDRPRGCGCAAHHRLSRPPRCSIPPARSHPPSPSPP
jgi:hypothetical protein